MKTLLSICVVMILVGASDLNPLLLWKPYQTWINEVMSSSPHLFPGIIILVLFVGIWISASYERQNSEGY